MARKRPFSVEIVEEPDGRFIVRTYADGEVVREPIVAKSAPRPRPIYRMKMDRTRKKSF